jgi:hypothetical protein
MRMFIAAFGVIACASAVFAEPTSAQRCEAIAKLALPDVAITSATLQTTGALKSDLGGTLTNLPLFCRVIGDATPTPRSHIGFEVWLPVDGWTGRYVQVGNGGLAGVIFHELMAQMLGRGHAVAATDDGHKGSPIDGSWAIGEPEKVRDFAERAVHVTNGIGKRVTTEYYGDRARHSYFFGCSEGGREALIAAQRFPEDFDGIVAGAPGNDWNNLLTAFVWNAQALHRDEGTFIPPDRLPAIQAAALAACDATDGVKDGIVSQPDRCKFDPRVLACGKAPADACLTQPQIDALARIYGGAHEPDGKPILAGYVPSGENEVAAMGGGVRQYIFGAAPGQSLNVAFATGYFGGLVFETRDWDFRKFDFARDLPIARAKLAASLDATDPDLSTFRKRGGKLLQYHGLLDGSIPPAMSTDYHARVVERMGGRANTDEFYRLFLAPGVLHCGFGPGPNAFGNLGPPGPPDAEHDTLRAVERWVERGVAPAHIIATKYVADDPSRGVQMTRPLCPHPQGAHWDGKGDTNTAASFRCAD